DALGHRCQGHRVCRGECGGVGQRDVEVVDEFRPPVDRLDAVIRHLREQEVRGAVRPGGAPAGTAPVELPIPQGEDQEVGEPDQDAGDDQLLSFGDLVVKEVVVNSTSENTLAALTTATSPTAVRRRSGCSCSSSRGVAIARPITSKPSSAGSSQLGPTVNRSGSVSCSPIAASTVSWAGQIDSTTPGGG